MYHVKRRLVGWQVSDSGRLLLTTWVGRGTQTIHVPIFAEVASWLLQKAWREHMKLSQLRCNGFLIRNCSTSYTIQRMWLISRRTSLAQSLVMELQRMHILCVHSIMLIEQAMYLPASVRTFPLRILAHGAAPGLMPCITQPELQSLVRSTPS